ncbi:hypothetical protein GCM10028777_20760 [Angustibacter speluncae]
MSERPAGLEHAWHTDDRTLRQVVTDPAALERRLVALGEQDEHRGERVSLLRLLGRLDEARTLAEADLDACAGGDDPAAEVLATVRLAQVRHWQGDLAVAQALLTSALSHAGAVHEPLLVGAVLQHRAKVRFDAGDLEGAVADAAAALKHRRQVGAPASQVRSSEQAWSTIAAAAVAAAPPGSPPPGSDPDDTVPVAEAGPHPS